VVDCLQWRSTGLCCLHCCVVQARNETKRITELLTELPADVDVEGLLIRSVVRAGSHLQAQAAATPAGPGASVPDIKGLGSRRTEDGRMRSRRSQEFDIAL
jgi:hypothetical protein